MIRIFLAACCLILITATVKAQTTDFPIKEWKASPQTAFVFLISGDGGFNSFTTELCTTINKAGYDITSLNAKSYFWNKKTPEQTTTDIVNYIESQLLNRKNQQIILVGYSFGADLIPFIVNRFPENIRKKLVSAVMLSPSTSTDFEIHLSDMFGSPKKRSMDVIAEINKMTNQKTAIIFGDDEDDFPKKDILQRNVVIESLPGGHHYDGNTAEVAKTMIKYFK